MADLARETSSSGLIGKEDSPPQEPPAATFCSGSSSEGRTSAAYDSLMMNLVPEVRQIPPPRWFVVYCRNGRGNFILASRYLPNEFGTIPEET
ncbi:hypothetical protein E2C01_059200 [Portunus trituberculatus]|uniref:Uncharacterized protein n=1 Tax=Portunus trituberculatus TaxID=210409 RepID=A0A5B7H8F6_PORTR|nr:hypothetical protein [Portunus trituberculatus]